MWSTRGALICCIPATLVLISGIGMASALITNEEWHVYQVLGLELHNRFRAKHNVSPLKLNETLNRAAQEFAEHRLKEIARNAKIAKVRGLYKNQQTFKAYSESPPNPNEAVKKAVTKWYSLFTPYHWKNPNYTAFSAPAWNGTTDLGIGVATNGIRTLVVAAYSNPENHEPSQTKSKSLVLLKILAAARNRPPKVH